MKEKNGLTSEEAKRKLEEVGLNQLPSKKTYSAFKFLTAQFKNLLIWLLIFAALLSYFVGHETDAILILVIMGLNVALGFWQEYKASKELEALRKLEVAYARVIRDGKQIKIPAYEIVPDDLVVLEQGDRVPADGVLAEGHDIYVNEAALTGESLPVLKTTEKDENELFFGTNVTAGRGILHVLKTGSSTKFGTIALTLSEVEEEKTPLEISLNGLARNLGIVAIAVAVLIFVLRWSQGYELIDNLTSSIALMVAAVPEGLPAVVTVLLALGVRKMYSKKTLVRKMSAVESLGATSVICTDKTGTLTKNEMSVRKVFADDKNLEQMLINGIVCNSSSLVLKNDGSVDILGDTTEGALLLWAKEKKLDYEEVRARGKILEEEPFSTETRRMSVLWEDSRGVFLYSKGAPESILPLCKLTEKERLAIEKEYKKMASDGLRVLAFAYKPVKDEQNSASSNRKKSGIEKHIQDSKFLGLVGIADAPRREAKEAIEKARKAGIITVMVTGDNELTAKAIGKELGLLTDGEEIITGAQLEELSDEQLKERLDKIRVFARVIPEHKLRIVRAYQSIGKIVAVTGDGVNDSLALKQAHVGVAMGRTGTDVAKEASDIIILDDNLATIVTAIEEGRRIYNNIFKVVKFLMTGNLSEVMVIVGAAVAGLPAPLTATQILWINFVTDGLPALSLAADGVSERTMESQPRDVNKSILDFKTVRYIFIAAFIIAAISLGSFIYIFFNQSLEIARGYAFTLVVVCQMFFVFAMRRHHSVFSNKYLLLSVAMVLVSQILIMNVPFLKNIFGIS